MSQEPDNDGASSQLLVHGRAKRATAGNRMHFLLQHLEDEDVRNDLLAEDETDQHDYELSDTEDVAFGSSDDDDDDGDDDELQGEQELQKAQRIEARKKKRKAHDFANMPLNPLMKRQRLGATNSLLAPRPRKKSERISWLPTLDDAPTRQSRRRQTVANKEQTEAKLKESQKRSEKAHELMRIAAEKKAAAAAPALTQADRMQRALKVEKENSRTLNRWEKAEEERQAAQQRRLDELRDRQLEGPVFRYWSGSVVWEGDRIQVNRVHQPRVDSLVENESFKDKDKSDPKDTPKSDVKDMDEPDIKDKDKSDPKDQEENAGINDKDKPDDKDTPKPATDDAVMVDAPPPGEDQTADKTEEGAILKSTVEATDYAKRPPSFLDGIHYWASHSPESASQKNTSLAQSESQSQSQTQQQPQTTTSTDPPLPCAPTEQSTTAATTTPFDIYPQIQPTEEQQQPPPPPLVREQAQRSLIILEAFPELDPHLIPPPTSSSSSKKTSSTSSTTTALLTNLLLPLSNPPLTASQQKYLVSKSTKKTTFLPPQPPKPVCAITSKPARFRDPKTGIAYRDLEAYKALQRVSAGGTAWSCSADCWMGIIGVGAMGRVARGVPEAFWCGVDRHVVKKEEEVVVIEDAEDGKDEQQIEHGVAASTAAPESASSS